MPSFAEPMCRYASIKAGNILPLKSLRATSPSTIQTPYSKFEDIANTGDFDYIFTKVQFLATWACPNRGYRLCIEGIHSSVTPRYGFLRQPFWTMTPHQRYVLCASDALSCLTIGTLFFPRATLNAQCSKVSNHIIVLHLI